MEFFEFLTIFTLFVILPSIILTNVRRIKEAKYKAGQGDGTRDALRMSELQMLIEAAVDEATAPLLARLEALEEERLLAAPRAPLALEMPEEEEQHRTPVAPTRQSA